MPTSTKIAEPELNTAGLLKPHIDTPEDDSLVLTPTPPTPPTKRPAEEEPNDAVNDATQQDSEAACLSPSKKLKSSVNDKCI